jgi:cellulose synthase/poly-beta-1,6-N-acetylglucosamine synthase-like glycosyltransferase
VNRVRSSSGRLSVIGALVLLSLAAVRNWQTWRHASRLGPEPLIDEPFEPASGWAARPSVSVLVAAWNEAPLIERHIASFAALNYPDLQMVLCAGGTDGTYALASRSAGPRIIVLGQHPGEGKQAALRRCLAAATGDVLVFTDADCVIADQPFERLIEPLTRGAQVTTGFDEPLPEQRADPFVLSQWLSVSGSRPRTPGMIASVLGRNCAVVRRTLESSSALDAPARTGTDYVLGHTLAAAGNPIHVVPDSRIMTRYPTDPRSYVGANRRWVKNLLIHAPRFGAWREMVITLVAVAIAATILLGPALATMFGARVLVFPLTAAGITTMNRIRRLAVGARLTRMRLSWRVLATVPVFVLLDQLSVLLAALDSVSQDGRSRW